MFGSVGLVRGWHDNAGRHFFAIRCGWSLKRCSNASKLNYQFQVNLRSFGTLRKPSLKARLTSSRFRSGRLLRTKHRLSSTSARLSEPSLRCPRSKRMFGTRVVIRKRASRAHGLSFALTIPLLTIIDLSPGSWYGSRLRKIQYVASARCLPTAPIAVGCPRRCFTRMYSRPT